MLGVLAMATNLVKQTIALETYQAAYLAWPGGDRDAPIALLLHGFLGESRGWQAVADQLAAQNVRCLALDLLGFGESSKPRLKYTIDHQVQFIQEFVRAMDLPPLFLVGYSYGGWAAAACAIEGAIGLRGLGLVAPAGIRDDAFAGRYAHLRPLLWETPLVDGALALARPVAGLLGQSAAWQGIHQARQALKNQPVARSFLVDRWRPEDAIDTVEERLDRIQVPTIAIAAEGDRTIPLWHVQTYANRIAGAQFVCLPDADHDLIHTHPVQVADLLRSRLVSGELAGDRPEAIEI
jgi:pimeloyl-ACP methyl ester carboxylesterase